MKAQDLYNSISAIDPVYLEKAEVYQPKKSRVIRRWLAAAACLALCLVGTLLFWPGDAPAPAVGLTAQAVEPDGTLRPTFLEQNESIVLSNLPLCGITDGFLFSAQTVPEGPSKVYVINTRAIDTAYETLEEAVRQQPWYESEGMHYFYFVPADTRDGTIESVVLTDETADGGTLQYGLLFTNEKGQVFATLDRLTSFPAKTDGEPG